MLKSCFRVMTLTCVSCLCVWIILVCFCLFVLRSMQWTLTMIHGLPYINITLIIPTCILHTLLMPVQKGWHNHILPAMSIWVWLLSGNTQTCLLLLIGVCHMTLSMVLMFTWHCRCKGKPRGWSAPQHKIAREKILNSWKYCKSYT